MRPWRTVVPLLVWARAGSARTTPAVRRLGPAPSPRRPRRRRGSRWARKERTGGGGEPGPLADTPIVLLNVNLFSKGEARCYLGDPFRRAPAVELANGTLATVLRDPASHPSL